MIVPQRFGIGPRAALGAAAICLSLGPVLDGPALGQCELAKVGPSDLEAGDIFGRSVSVDGDLAVVGASRDATDGVKAGSAAVFSRDVGGTDNWAQVAKLVAFDGAKNDDFGYAATLAGDLVVVGSPRDDDAGGGSGSAYVYARNQGGTDNWGLVRKITASDARKGDRFGSSIALAGDTLLVGAYRNDDDGSNSGSAYVFMRNEGGSDAWGEVTKLTASDGRKGDYFGISVSVHGDVALVGSYRDDDDGFGSGSAYVFGRDHGGADQWGQVAKLTASDAAANAQFGFSVSVHGDLALVGAYVAGQTGAAYVFSRDEGGADQWGEIASISPGGLDIGDGFGYTVSLEGGLAAVTAISDDDQGDVAGAVYVLDRFLGGADNWGVVTKLTASDGGAADLFGISVDIHGDVVLAGADLSDAGGTNAGAAYAYLQDEGGTDAWGEIARFVPTDGAGDDFAHAVGIDGAYAIAGAPLDAETGTASVYRRDADGLDAWGRVAMLTASDGAVGDEFGDAVAVSGDTIVVGAHRDADAGPATGAAYVFDRTLGSDDWVEVAKIMPDDESAYDHFGASVAIDGDLVLVGSPLDDPAGMDSGSVYVFARNEGGSNAWGEEAKLTPDDGGTFDEFGVSVSLSGDLAIIGADGNAHPDPSNGAAYVFARDEGGVWTQIAKLTANDNVAYDQFGLSVTIDGDLAAVGCPFDDDGAIDAGSVYVFGRDQGGPDAWGVSAKLLGDNPLEEARFGISVALDGETLLVGSDRNDDAAPDAGAIYVFGRNLDGPDAWGQVVLSEASDAEADAGYGNAVAVSGDRAVVGAEFDDYAGPDAGAMYVLDLVGVDCNANGVCDSREIQAGTVADGNENGIPDGCECLADLSGDGLVDWWDQVQLLQDWGPCVDCAADITFDDVVDMEDLLEQMANFGPCP